MMKKVLSIFLFVLLTFGIVGCSNATGGSTGSSVDTMSETEGTTDSSSESSMDTSMEGSSDNASNSSTEEPDDSGEEIVEYTVHFNSNGGAAKEAVKVKFAQAYDLGVAPTHQTLHFMYWTYNGVKVDSATWTIEPSTGSEITLDAVWGVQYIFDKSVVYDNYNRVVTQQNGVSPTVVLIEYGKNITVEQFISPQVVSSELTENYIFFWKNGANRYRNAADLPVANSDMTFTVMVINRDWVSE